MGICQVPKIVIGSKNTEQGSLKIYGKNADALILGDATHEGGDISVYRDTSGNKQLFVDADAASNAIALSVYGGVVAQNYLTVGQSALSTIKNFFVNGTSQFNGSAYFATAVIINGNIETLANDANINMTIPITGTDSIAHSIQLQIDANNIIEVKATGDGAGGITNKAIGLYGGSPTTQAAAISDPAETIAGNNAAIDAILVALRNLSVIAT